MRWRYRCRSSSIAIKLHRNNNKCIKENKGRRLLPLTSKQEDGPESAVNSMPRNDAVKTIHRTRRRDKICSCHLALRLRISIVSKVCRRSRLHACSRNLRPRPCSRANRHLCRLMKGDRLLDTLLTTRALRVPASNNTTSSSNSCVICSINHRSS